jgi:hypothetical protein
MDHRQEIILDRLVGAKRIGVQYRSGPLGIAVEALVEKKLVHRRDAKAALGFPKLMCQGIQGANNHLPGIEERRSLAISFFSAVKPHEKPPRLTARRHAEIVLWAARRVHPLVCREDCPYLLAVVRWMAANPSAAAVPREVDDEAGCSAWTNPGVRNHRRGTASYQAIRALNYVHVTVTASRPGDTSQYGPLHAGAAAALHGGAATAADFCIGLARELGL